MFMSGVPTSTNLSGSTKISKPPPYCDRTLQQCILPTCWTAVGLLEIPSPIIRIWYGENGQHILSHTLLTETSLWMSLSEILSHIAKRPANMRIM
jgi:hypothetical protein